jgi:hypothetical protein
MNGGLCFHFSVDAGYSLLSGSFVAPASSGMPFAARLAIVPILVEET